MTTLRQASHLLNALIARVLFPLAMLVSCAGLALAWHQGWDAELVLAGTGAFLLVTVSLLERLMPYRKEWNRPLEDRATDWTSLIMLVAVADPLIKWLTPVLAVSLYAATDRATMSAWMDMPFWAQLSLVTLVAEFGKYWSHRWHHSHPALWWLHAMHHSSERLYALNNLRLHPLNHFINHLAGLLPLMLLGAPPDALLGYVALTQPALMMQHANLPLRHGFLNLIFSTNEVHRWHHSSLRSEGDHNFGSALLIWDHVFGTYKHPAPTFSPVAIGLYQPSRYPARASYLQQLKSLFSPACCAA